MHDIDDTEQVFSTSEQLATQQIERVLHQAISVSHRALPCPSEALIISVFQAILDRSEIPPHRYHHCQCTLTDNQPQASGEQNITWVL